MPFFFLLNSVRKNWAKFWIYVLKKLDLVVHTSKSSQRCLLSAPGFRRYVTSSTWTVMAETRGPTWEKRRANWCVSSGTRSASARRGVRPWRPRSEWLAEAAEGAAAVEAACMEAYPLLTTQAGGRASPAWRCCMGRSSAAPEALRPPLTVSTVCIYTKQTFWLHWYVLTVMFMWQICWHTCSGVMTLRSWSPEEWYTGPIFSPFVLGLGLYL